MLGSKFKALEAEGFTIQMPDWKSPTAGINPRHTVIVVDCNLPSPDPTVLIATCRKAFPEIPIIGFVSHVDTVSKEAAELAGATAVYPRSRFFSQTAGLLRGHVKSSGA